MASEYLEGRHALEEALDSGAPVQTIYATDALLADKRFARTIKRAQRMGVPIERASQAQLDQGGGSQ